MPKSLTTCSREHSLPNPGANQIPLRSSWHFRERSRVESSPALDAAKIHRYPPNPSEPLNVKPPIGRYFEPRPVRNRRRSTSNNSSTRASGKTVDPDLGIHRLPVFLCRSYCTSSVERVVEWSPVRGSNRRHMKQHEQKFCSGGFAARPD